MSSRTKLKNAQIAVRGAGLPKIPKELLDQIAGPEGLISGDEIQAANTALKKTLIERALVGKRSHRLGF